MSDPQKLELQVSRPMWVLGTELLNSDPLPKQKVLSCLSGILQNNVLANKLRWDNKVWLFSPHNELTDLGYSSQPHPKTVRQCPKLLLELHHSSGGNCSAALWEYRDQSIGKLLEACDHQSHT